MRLMAISNTGGWRNIANTKKQIRTPNDVNGLKVRTIKADVQIELVKAMGGNPTPISWPEVYTSLATGVVDGTKNGITDIVRMKFHEHWKHITLDGHAYMGALWFLSEAIGNSSQERTSAFCLMGSSTSKQLLERFQCVSKYPRMRISRKLEEPSMFQLLQKKLLSKLLRHQSMIGT